MQSMKGATKLLGSMNRQMNLPSLQRIAMEFERENDIMDQREEMVNETVDEGLGEDEDEETDEVVDQVLTGLGVELNQSLQNAPEGIQTAQANTKVAQAVGGDGGVGGDDDDDLQARLDNLRK